MQALRDLGASRVEQLPQRVRWQRIETRVTGKASVPASCSKRGVKRSAADLLSQARSNLRASRSVGAVSRTHPKPCRSDGCAAHCHWMSKRSPVI